MENLGLDLKLIFSQLLNFLVFFFIYTKFIAKPFNEYVAKQKQAEADRQTLTEGLAKREEQMKAEQEKLKNELKKERETILAEAKKDVENVRAELIQKAEADAKEIVERSKKQLEGEREEMVKEMKDQTIELSVAIVSKALSDSLTPDAQKNITKNILEKVSKEDLNV